MKSIILWKLGYILFFFLLVLYLFILCFVFFFFQAEDGIRDDLVTGVQTCALPISGPMMAKSLEDTTFYRYHRLLALNEVGGDPAANAIAPERFHAMMAARAREWPHGLTATATHDTKRGEDERARIMALAEIPGEWTSAVARWKEH